MFLQLGFHKSCKRRQFQMEFSILAIDPYCLQFGESIHLFSTKHNFFVMIHIMVTFGVEGGDFSYVCKLWSWWSQLYLFDKFNFGDVFDNDYDGNDDDDVRGTLVTWTLPYLSFTRSLEGAVLTTNPLLWQSSLSSFILWKKTKSTLSKLFSFIFLSKSNRFPQIVACWFDEILN